MKSFTKLLGLFFIYLFSFSGIITHINREDKVVFLTFDACETRSPAYFDRPLLEYIVENKLPVTLFLSGKFIERNREDVEKISRSDFIRIENHSYSHRDFRRLSPSEIREDVLKNEQLIYEVTGRKPRLFRFPYGYYTEEAIGIIEELGYRIVHWSFESGDPDRTLTSNRLYEHVISNSRNGSILIFHINGRGWKTGEVLPHVVKYLREKGFRFELLGI